MANPAQRHLIRRPCFYGIGAIIFAKFYVPFALLFCSFALVLFPSTNRSPLRHPRGMRLMLNSTFFSDACWWRVADRCWATGPWAAARSLPQHVSPHSADKRNADVLKAAPAEVASPASRPTIFAHQPCGDHRQRRPADSVAPSAGTAAYVRSGSDLFFVPATRAFYYLTSGRWVRVGRTAGP